MIGAQNILTAPVTGLCPKKTGLLARQTLHIAKLHHKVAAWVLEARSLPAEEVKAIAVEERGRPARMKHQSRICPHRLGGALLPLSLRASKLPTSRRVQKLHRAARNNSRRHSQARRHRSRAQRAKARIEGSKNRVRLLLLSRRLTSKRTSLPSIRLLLLLKRFASRLPGSVPPTVEVVGRKCVEFPCLALDSQALQILKAWDLCVDGN